MTALQIPYRFTYASHKSDSIDRNPHAHPHAELLYVAEGTVEIGDRRVQAVGSKGTVYILPPEIPHYQKTITSMTSFAVRFLGADIAPGDPPRVVSAAGDRLVQRWFEDLFDLYSTGSKRGPENDALLFSLLHRLDIDGAISSIADMHPALSKATEYIRRRMPEVVSVDEIAEQACVSRPYLNKLFHSHFGCGPRHYLIMYRLNRADRLIRTAPYKSIKEIAEICGFEDPAYFSRLFKRHKEASPTEIRDSLRPTE